MLELSISLFDLKIVSRALRSCVSTSVIAVMTAGFAQAQDEDALSIKVGEADLTPIVRIDYISNSNAFLNADNEVDTTGFVVSPAATFRADRRLLALEFGYVGAYGIHGEDALDFDDHTLFADVEAELSARRRVAGRFSVVDRHEELGRNFTLGAATAGTELVELVETELVGSFTFGAIDAKGNITAGLDLSNTTYVTQENLTDGRDFTEVTPYAQFSYRLSVDTRALIELRLSNFDFDEDRNDRTDVELLAGLSFRGTGRTGGQIKVGYTDASFSEDDVEDTNLLSADINVYFLPTSFSRIDLVYQREIDNTSGTSLVGGDDQATRDIFSANWAHQWSAFANTRAFATYNQRDRQCPDNSTSDGEVGLEIGLKPRRWVEFGAGARFSDRSADSCPNVVATDEDLDFDRQLINVFVRISL